MGADKAAAEVGGSPMLDRIAAAAADAEAARITVVSSRGSLEGYETIPDIFRGKGALGGIHSALKHATYEAVFIAACDFPLISAEFIRLLVDRFNGGSGWCVIPEQSDGVLQPLAAVYSRSRCRPICEEILADESTSNAVKALLERVEPLLLPFDEYAHLPTAENILINVNTPEELERAGRLAAGQSPSDGGPI